MTALYFDYKNIQLLWDLSRGLDAHGPGDLHGFMDTPADWHCRSCLRSKPEIARLDANGNLLCRIVLHHDHMDQFMPAEMSSAAREVSFTAQNASRDHVIRFLPELICQDCNVAESTAKHHVGAPNFFSFAPHEISLFIDVFENKPHRVRVEDAKGVYEELRPILRRLATVVKATEKKFASVEDWEPLRTPLERLLSNAMKKPE